MEESSGNFGWVCVGKAVYIEREEELKGCITIRIEQAEFDRALHRTVVVVVVFFCTHAWTHYIWR